MAITIPTPGEVAALSQKPAPEVLESNLVPTKARHELSTDKTPAVTITRYSDDTTRQDWSISQQPVVQPEGGLPIQ